MGEFDDVLAMEPGDEWDDYDPTDHSGPVVELAPLVAALHAPAATVELRGQVPDELVEALRPLTATPEVRSPHHVVVPVEIAEVDSELGDDSSRRWSIVDRERGEHGRAGSVDEVARSLVEQVLDASRRADVRQQLLAVAGVRLADGRGALVVEPDTTLRHRLVAALVDGGAGYLGADQVAVLAGSRTVLACPTPLTGTGGPDPAAVVPLAGIDLVLVPDVESSSPSVERLTRAHGAARLLAATLPAATDAPEVVRVVATLLAGAGVWSVAASDPAAFVDAVTSLAVAAPRELVRWRRLQAASDDLVLVRFAEGATLVDLASGVVLEADRSELAALDSLGWSTGPAAGEQSDVLEALARAGIDLRPVATARGARPPGPETYGLPDAPAGTAAVAAWSAQELAPWASERTVAAWLDQGAQGAELHPDPATRETLRATSRQLDARRRTVESVVCDALDLLDGLGVMPLVVGPLVLACDGPAPAELFEIETVDLLVAADQLRDARRVLAEVPGAIIDAPAGGGEERAEGEEPPTSGPLAVRVERDGETVTVTLRDRLAAGPFGELVDHDELLDRAVPFRLGERWVGALHPDDRVVFACVQAVAPGAALGERRDVVLEAPSSREGMAAVLEASARWGATRSVLEAIRSVDAQLPGLAHWLVERATRPAPAPEKRRRRGRLGRR